MTRLIIKITECSGEHREWSGMYDKAHAARYDSLIDLISAVTKKEFGQSAFFWESSELPGYGQIAKRISRDGEGGYTCLTGRVRVDFYKSDLGLKSISRAQAQEIFEAMRSES